MENDTTYRLTWPADQRGVATVAGQWQRNDAGEVEAWYTAAQLAAALAAMRDVREWQGRGKIKSDIETK